MTIRDDQQAVEWHNDKGDGDDSAARWPHLAVMIDEINSFYS
jgi:hypothetical protein